MSAMIPFFSSCSDDDSVNEWDMSYVSLLPADYLQPTPSFTLKHVEEEGIEGSVEFQFMATTQKAIAQDINVRYSVTCDGIDADKINLSDKNLVIKGGSTASEPITLSITDWKYLESTKEALDYTLKIKITDIESTSSEVANAAYYQEIILKISKTAEKKKDRIVEQIETGENRMFTYLIILAQPPVNQMEILTPATSRSQAKKNGEPLILGVACGWHEAQEVVRVIVEDVYIKTGDALVRQYFEGK